MPSPITTVLMAADALGLLDGLFTTRWGIYRFGRSVVTAQQVRSFSMRQSWSIANYPTESGGFQSYNKVSLPYEPRVEFASAGNEATRAALVASIRAIAGNLLKYDVVTPEAVFTSCNITHFDIAERTSDRGAGLIRISVYLEQIRTSARAQYGTAAPMDQTKSPSATTTVNTGTVQSTNPSRERIWVTPSTDAGWNGH